MVNGSLPETGTVGVGVSVDRANELASICALNAMAAIKALIGDLDKVQRVVKVVGFVNSAPDFTNHPAVINGASNLLLAAFGDAGIHARSSIGVAALPLDAPVEVELIVEVAD
jgi:enamine deaminase RidA (YjgF/YER057c/UK114 family)